MTGMIQVRVRPSYPSQASSTNVVFWLSRFAFAYQGTHDARDANSPFLLGLILCMA
jgi:hypothetical protein